MRRRPGGTAAIIAALRSRDRLGPACPCWRGSRSPLSANSAPLLAQKPSLCVRTGRRVCPGVGRRVRNQSDLRFAREGVTRSAVGQPALAAAVGHKHAGGAHRTDDCIRRRTAAEPGDRNSDAPPVPASAPQECSATRCAGTLRRGSRRTLPAPRVRASAPARPAMQPACGPVATPKRMKPVVCWPALARVDPRLRRPHRCPTPRRRRQRRAAAARKRESGLRPTEARVGLR